MLPSSARAMVSRLDKEQVFIFRSKGHTVGAYAAAAKGWLLHFMLNKDWRCYIVAGFVLDDALKQDTYCPGLRSL
jgi:hypothetical protein